MLRTARSRWAVAVLVTVALAAFQRMTGPTHPLRGETNLGPWTVGYRLLRSHGGPGGLPVSIRVPEGLEVRGTLLWRRYPGDHPWEAIPMDRLGDRIHGQVPHQPPAGKVEYRVVLEGGEGRVELPAVVARFKGAVPTAVLVPHILSMFLSMLLATYALLTVLRGDREPRASVLVSMAFLVVGGLILGPMVQKHAFGAYWTGWPYGTDLTDNKTAIAFLAWLPATVGALAGRRLRWKVLLGWIVMMGVFLIPHSLRGSQIDWETTHPADPAVSSGAPGSPGTTPGE